MRHLIEAIQFLTRLPTPRRPAGEVPDLGRASVYFPLVGGLVGVVVAAAVLLGGLINAAVAGLAGVVAWVLVTGGLHLDGLGDVADGLGAAHRDPERFQQVLRDPHVGSFAVTAIALQIVAKVVLLGSLALLDIAAMDLALAVVLVPAWARWGTLVWSHVLAPLWAGLGSQSAKGLGWPPIVGWGVALCVSSVLVAPQLLVALAVVPLVVVYWRSRLGGITGDCLGASIEIVETALLLALLIPL